MRTICILLMVGAALWGQLGAPASGGSTSTAAQLPLSGRAGQSGSVTAAESPIPGATTSVNTLNTTLQIQGPYSGSARSAAKLPFTGKLSLREAIQRGLDYNLAAIGMATAVRQAHGQERVARSVLLPNLNGAF